MLTFILLLGFFSIVFIPMLCMLYSEAKLTQDNSEEGFVLAELSTRRLYLSAV